MGWQPIETAPKDGTRILLFGEILTDYGGDEGKNMRCIGYYDPSSSDWACEPVSGYGVYCTPKKWAHLIAEPLE